MTRIAPFCRAWLEEKDRSAGLRRTNERLRRELAVARAQAAMAREEAADARAWLSLLLDSPGDHRAGPAVAAPCPPLRSGSARIKALLRRWRPGRQGQGVRSTFDLRRAAPGPGPRSRIR